MEESPRPGLLIRAVHGILVAIAQLPLFVAFAAFGLFALLALAAHAVHPRARFGNCWTYATPRFLTRGGYLSFRRALGIALLGRIPILHALWHPSLGEVRMTYPRRRRASRWLPWFAALFHFEVWHGDPHALEVSDEQISSVPEPWQTTRPPKL